MLEGPFILSHLFVTDIHHEILWILCRANLLIENINFVGRREFTGSLLSNEGFFSVEVTIVLLISDIFPIVSVGGIRVATGAELFHLVEILEDQHIVPALILAELLKFVVVEFHIAAKEH